MVVMATADPAAGRPLLLMVFHHLRWVMDGGLGGPAFQVAAWVTVAPSRIDKMRIADVRPVPVGRIRVPHFLPLQKKTFSEGCCALYNDLQSA